MLAATAIILGTLQPPAFDPMRPKPPVVSPVEQQVNDLNRWYQELQQRAADSERESNETLKSIERTQKEIKEMIEKFEKVKKSKQK